MYQRGWLKGVIEAFGTHTGGGDAPEFRIENLNQPACRFLVAIAKACHQVGYGMGLERDRDRQLGDYSNLRKKNLTLSDTI